MKLHMLFPTKTSCCQLWAFLLLSSSASLISNNSMPQIHISKIYGLHCFNPQIQPFENFSLLMVSSITKKKKNTCSFYLTMAPHNTRGISLFSAGDHSGFLRTYHWVKHNFFWPGIRRDVKNSVAHCIECQRQNHETIHPLGFFAALTNSNGHLARHCPWFCRRFAII